MRVVVSPAVMVVRKPLRKCRLRRLRALVVFAKTQTIARVVLGFRMDVL